MKIVVVTGASRGIGLATAKKFLDEGWHVIGTYLDKGFPISHKNLTPIQYDQGSPESIASAVEQIKKLTTNIDSLINNAGVLLDPQDKWTDPAKVRKTLEINVVGVIDLTEHLLAILQKGSHIVNLNSGYGVISDPEFDSESSAGYRISKTALNMYTRHLAFRLQSRGIVVSALAPGWVQTDMGYSISTEIEKPNRTPDQAADDIYNLVTTVTETGYFWEFGEKINW
ncbi:MAG TPA: SDR family NAD(P)-dependent oxidoreductase [Candidatus Paceibacterota bacterium]